MSDRADKQFTSRETLDEAQYWFEVLRSDDVSETKVLGWLAWYEASDEHSRAFDELQKMHGLVRNLLTGSQRDELGAQLQSYRWWHRLFWRAESWLAMRVGNWNPSLLLRRGVLVSGLGLVAIIAALVVKALLMVPATTSTTFLVAPQQRLISAMTLPDDSKIELAPRTPVSVAYSASERRLEMGTGEALFVVAHQKNRPFIVYVDALRVRAVGTQFNIHRTGDRVEVTVIEGKIDVYRDGKHGNEQYGDGAIYHIPAGNRFTVAGATDAGSLAAVETHDALTWRDGRLQYEHVPLGSVIADLNRYVSKPIVIEDARVEAISYTGSVFVEAIDEWLSAIAKEFQLVIVTGADSTRLIAGFKEQNNAP